MSKDMLTTDDIAEYLHIHKNQIYRLIKEKRLPATRITGKWLFPKQLVDEWICESAREMTAPVHSPETNRIVIAGSNDIALEMLTKSVHLQNPGFTISLSNLGSAGGLEALGKGNCHVASSHLLDIETGDYNTPFVKRNLPERKVRLVNLAYREQGLLLKKGNPLGIRTLEDIARRKAVFINRQEGSGTRVLLDFKLREKGLSPSDIKGYASKAYTHMEVALAIFQGSADAGMGIRAAAQLLKLDFIPIANERFDLVIPEEHYSTAAVDAIRQALVRTDFKSAITHLGGYDTHDTGKVLYEKG